MQLVKILKDGDDIGLYFWDKASAVYYLENNSQAYHYAPELYTFETFEPLNNIVDPQDIPCKNCGEFLEDHPELTCKAKYDGLSCYKDSFEPGEKE